MLGYRLIREADLKELTEQCRELLRALETQKADHTAEIRVFVTNHQDHAAALVAKKDEIYERLLAATGEARARAAMVDLLTVQLNVANSDLAILRQKHTGVSQTVASIGKGSALSASQLGVGADLFEDVGDARAAELIERGVITAPEGMPEFPAAGKIAPQ